MSQDAAAESLYMERKVAGLCTRCGKEADEDSSLCRKHRRQRNAAAAACMARKRDALRAQGLCIYNCGTSVGKEDYACLACRVRIGRTQRKLVSLGSVNPVVSQPDKAAAIAAATRRDPDGRTRYHGQQRRGQQTHAQLNAQDLRMAIDSWEAFCAGVRLTGAPEFKLMHRAQRDALKTATASHGERLSGHIDDILERLGHFQLRHGRRDGER